MKQPERSTTHPRPRRRGWIPLGLPGQILLVGALVPAASLAPEVGSAVADGLNEAGGAVLEQLESGYHAVERWAHSTFDPRTRTGGSAVDRRWAASVQ